MLQPNNLEQQKQCVKFCSYCSAFGTSFYQASVCVWVTGSFDSLQIFT